MSAYKGAGHSSAYLKRGQHVEDENAADWSDCAGAGSRFCGRTVPLARLPKRVCTTVEKLEAEIEVAHFGTEPLTHAELQWQLVGSDGARFARGVLPPRDIPVNNGIRLGTIQVDLRGAKAPERYRLVTRVAKSEIQNDWDVWVYPARLPLSPRTFWSRPN